MWIMTPRTWLVLTFVVLLPACATNPVTGKRQLTLVSEAQEIELGRQAAEQVEQSIGLVDDAPLQAYVNRVGTALAAESERPRLPWAAAVQEARGAQGRGARAARALRHPVVGGPERVQDDTTSAPHCANPLSPASTGETCA